MDVTRRLIGTSAITNGTPQSIGLDINGIVRRLILFNTYVLKSHRLQEFPFLISNVGVDGTMRLLQSQAFEIECESVTVGQTGQTTVLESRARKGSLPLLSYCLSGIDIGDRTKYLHDCLQPLHTVPNLTHKQIVKLKRAILEKLVRPPQGFAGTIAAQATSDVQTKPHLVKKSVEMAIRQILNVQPPEFSISVHPIDAQDSRVETDLPSRLQIDTETAHNIVGRGLLAIAGMSHRFAEMEAYSAISGFTEHDLPLVDAQLDFLFRSIAPEVKERQFRRVVEIAGFPDFGPALNEKRVNIARLLEIRESDECREFREWLPTIENASDAEIKERISSLRAKFGNAIQSYPGKLVRLLATTGIGSIPLVGPVAGALAGVVDTFLLERVLPKSGVVAFLSRVYPSIF